MSLEKTLELTQTCAACPEQYDAKIDGETVGYLRLRWSHFTVHCPNAGGELVYEADVSGAGWSGAFTVYERKQHLPAAIEAVQRWLRSRTSE